jgi:hypothetical protein
MEWIEMEWKMIDLAERTDIDKNGKFYRYKEATFDVNGSTHTLRISMSDFDAGRTKELVQRDVDKLLAALGTGKSK